MTSDEIFLSGALIISTAMNCWFLAGWAKTTNSLATQRKLTARYREMWKRASSQA